MTATELLLLVSQLSRADNLRVMQFLIAELVREEKTPTLQSGAIYWVWTPLNSHTATHQLGVGKTRYTRERFRDGHKTLMWAWLDFYSPDDVALAIYPLDFIQVKTLSSQLEAIIVAAADPPYNVRYPARD